ncbi:MAG: BTAD domain-containing putative transcriptional regulator [Actinomycetales bacterium]
MARVGPSAPCRPPAPSVLDDSTIPACPFRLRTLGGFELLAWERPVTVAGPAARVVALSGLRGRLHRDQLADELWPGALGDRGRAYLRSALWRLGTLAKGVVLTQGEMISIAPEVQVDATQLLGWATGVTRDGVATQFPAGLEVGAELLPGWSDSWLIDYREQLNVLVPQALEDVAVARLEQGQPATALWCAMAAHRCDPLRESAVRILLLVLLEQGNRHRARLVFTHYRHRLRDELGIEPSPGLARLMAQRGGTGGGR